MDPESYGSIKLGYGYALFTKTVGKLFSTFSAITRSRVLDSRIGETSLVIFQTIPRFLCEGKKKSRYSCVKNGKLFINYLNLMLIDQRPKTDFSHFRLF